MELNIDDPRKTSREVLQQLGANRFQHNEPFIRQLVREIKRHPFCSHPVIKALRDGAFDRRALAEMHLDFRFGGVDVFTDAILCAQFQTREFEARLGRPAKMAGRFLILLNILDEFGYQAGPSRSGYYRGHPALSHPILFDDVIDMLDRSHEIREGFQPSDEARELRACFEGAFDNMLQLMALLTVTEEEAQLYSPPMRQAARKAGLDVDNGYYMVHGSSTDEDTTAADDLHQTDIVHILMCTLDPSEHGPLREAVQKSCELWDRFWHAQLRRLTRS